MCFWKIRTTFLACVHWLGFWAVGSSSQFFPWGFFISSSSFYWQNILSWWYRGHKIISAAIIYSIKCGNYNSPNKNRRPRKTHWNGPREQAPLHSLIPRFETTMQTILGSVCLIVVWSQTPALRIIHHHCSKESDPTRCGWCAFS